MNLRHVFLGAALLGLGCNYQSTSECECEAPPPEAAAICDPAGPLETELHFQTSPGGVTEVDHHFVAEHGCKVRLVDVREPEEVAAGIVAGSEAIPLDRVLEAASEWNPQDPVVFVCRSGRRSGRAVGLLQRMGFLRAASLTGGVLTWTAAGLPLAEGPALPRLEAEPAHVAPAGPDGPITAAELQASLSEISIPHVRAAGLLLQSSASCVDGRDESAVMGTPGGDAGELLLALATIEQLTGETLDADQVRTVFDHYVEAFGRFYFHTDDHAREHLIEELSVDEDFLAIRDFDALLRSPPPELQPQILAAYTDPHNVGCGHLKLVLLHPDEYRVRPELTRIFLQTIHRERWNYPELVDYVVLHGSHEEDAILTVHHHGDADVHAFTNVPAIPPRVGGRTVFVHHPLVARFLRSQHADFLMNELDMLRAHGVDGQHFEAALEDNAANGLRLTIGYLAPDLPVFDVRVGDYDQVVVEPARDDCGDSGCAPHSS